MTEAKRLAQALDNCAPVDFDGDFAKAASVIRAQAAEEEVLQKQIANLKTVMIAAAEEIHAHWDAHCNAEGYGPQNLMRRLEEGIPSEYGYTAGAFEALRADAERAKVLGDLLCELIEHPAVGDFTNQIDRELLTRWQDACGSAIDAARKG